MENLNDEQLKSLQKEGLSELIHILYNIDNEELLYKCFECLFTPPELEDLGKRWLLVKEIDKGTPQREIAQKFHMSLCKITRGSKELKKSQSAFNKMLEIAKDT